MKCEDFEPLMADALGNELSDEDRPAFEEHLVNCEPCRRDYQSLRGTVASLKTLPGPQKVSVRREGSKLVIDEVDDGRWPHQYRGRRNNSWLFRYVASVLVAFLGGYAFHATQGDDGPGAVAPSVPDSIQDSPRDASGADLHGALVKAHVGKPRRPDLAKALIALGGAGR